MTQTTMLGELRRSCREWPDRTAVVSGDTALTYRDLWRAVTDQAVLYRRLGVRPGDRVVCALPNCPEHLVAMGAAWACGAAHVAAGMGATAHDVGWLVGHVQARVLLAGRSPADVPDGWPSAARSAHPEVRIATCEDVAGVEPDGEPVAEVAEEDTAVIRFSSGTTGTPKGLVARHGPTARGWTNLAAAVGFGPDDIHLGHLPLSFGFGLQMAMLPLLSGGRLVLMDRFRPGPARELIERHRVTVLDGVPAGFRQLLDAPGAPEQVASLRIGIGSGDGFPPSLIARIHAELGMELVLMYGTVEGFGMLTRERRLMLAGSVGRPAPGSVRVLDAAGRPVAAGAAGEVAFRRHAGAPTPWGNGAGVAPWYHTGDLGRLDGNGWLHLTGRLKHQINRGGLKVDPVEVAGQLLGCAGVADAVVVGLPDPVLGEVPCACVVPSDPARPPALEALQAELRRTLAPYKVPAALHVLAEMPLTHNGKADVALLRREAAAAAPRAAASVEAPAPAAPETAEPARGPVTLPAIEQELARLVHDVLALRDGLDGPDRALLERIAAQAAGFALHGPRRAALPSGRIVTTAVISSTDGMRAWWGDLRARIASAAEAPPADADAPAVAERVLDLARSGGEAGRLAWRLFLGCARQALAPLRHLPGGPDRVPAEVVVRALADLMGPTPLHVGRPAFVTDALLDELRAEAAERREAATLDQGMLMAAPGEAARRFAYRDEMRALLAGLGQRVEASGSGKYVYCDRSAPGPGWHLHELPFVLNVELSLEHVSPGRRGAQIVLGQPFREPRPVRTEPGDMVVWFAGCVPHTRDEVAEGERLTGLSMFYEPVR